VAVRLAAVSDDLSTDFLDAARCAAGLGLEGLAVRNIEGRGVLQLDRATLQGVRRIADDHALAIEAVTTQIGRGVAVGEALGTELPLLERAIVCADILGAPVIRIFARWLVGQDAVGEWHRRASRDVLERSAEALIPLAARAQSAGTRLMLELEGASCVGTVAEAVEVFGSVGSPALELCWDICNGWWSGELPWEQGWPVAQSMPIADVQAKDVCRSPEDPRRAGLTQVVLGDGDIPYRRIVSALVAAGYSGVFTAERVFHPLKPEEDPRLRAAIVADLEHLRDLVETASALIP
jgi:sugar phosphate isomerase/epimerase